MEEYFTDQLDSFPIKSIGWHTRQRFNLNERGFEFNRYWMLVAGNYQKLSQRDYPKPNLLKIIEEVNYFKSLNPISRFSFSKYDNFVKLSKIYN